MENEKQNPVNHNQPNKTLPKNKSICPRCFGSRFTFNGTNHERCFLCRGEGIILKDDNYDVEDDDLTNCNCY